jgi:hypothetical protein
MKRGSAFLILAVPVIRLDGVLAKATSFAATFRTIRHYVGRGWSSPWSAYGSTCRFDLAFELRRV